MSHQHYVFTLRQQPDIRSGIKLRNAASARYGGDWSSIPHTHSYLELFYVVGGVGQFRIDGDLFPVHENQLVIVNPNILHTEVSYGDHPLEYIVVGIEGPELSIGHEHDGRFCILSIPPSDPILFYMRNILLEMQNRPLGYEAVCQAFTEILIIHLLRNANFSVGESPTVAPINSQCVSVRHYIESHYKEHLTLDQLADAANMNKYYLAHAFKREYGVSPINYLLACRIREGKRLLEETSLSLSQIAGILGFSSPSYFSQAFRRCENISPLEYRKQHQTSPLPLTGD